jgi:copper chaperone CopZ
MRLPKFTKILELLKKYSEMKKIFILSIILLVSAIANAQIIKAELTATGLTCSMCSKATYKQLTSIPEVEKVEPDLNNTAFILFFKNGSSVNVSNIKDKVEEAGFAVGELLVVFNFKNQQAENNKTFTVDNIVYTFMDTKSVNLEGEVKVKILDKGYVVEKEYKKLSKMIKQYPSYATLSKNSYHIKTL